MRSVCSIDQHPPHRRHRLPILLLLSGLGIVAALGVLLIDSWRLETRLGRARADQAHAVAERLLQRAPASRAAFDAVPPEWRAVLTIDGIVDASEVGWLEPSPSPLDRDLVVEDRLVRAGAAEFADGDPAAAERQLDELLAAPLPTSQRLKVVHTAAWHAVRVDDSTRLARLRAELDEAVMELQPGDLARPALARVLGGALRLPRAEVLPPAMVALARFLPPEVFAAWPANTGQEEAHRLVLRRRAFLREIGDACRGRVATAHAPLGAVAGHGLVAADERRLLWWFGRADGSADVALVTPQAWCAAVEAASFAGALPELPSPYALAAAADTGRHFGDVPGVQGVVALVTSASPVWLGPALTGVMLALLLVAFALALGWQLRAGRREIMAARLQAQFLTTVTHELKTPLAGIHLLGEMLAEGRAPGREHEYYRLLVGEAGRLAMLIDNVLDLGRLERGERGVLPRPVDVGEVVVETLAMFAPIAERDGLVVSTDRAAAGLVARVDRAAFVQALVAVLDNARKYGATGGVIEVGCAATDGAVEVTVRDRGPGVPEDEREHIFERFVRGAAHRHGSAPGVGIGLFLARALMRRQRCELRFARPSDGGPGSAFVFQLPLENAA